MMCLAENFGMCKWSDHDSEGLRTGGWSTLMSKCNGPKTNLVGSDAVNNWCERQTGTVAIYDCLRNNANMCEWGQWSALYNKCSLNKLPEVQPLQGSDKITNWCNKKVGGYRS